MFFPTPNYLLKIIPRIFMNTFMILLLILAIGTTKSASRQPRNTIGMAAVIVPVVTYKAFNIYKKENPGHSFGRFLKAYPTLLKQILTSKSKNISTARTSLKRFIYFGGISLAGALYADYHHKEMNNSPQNPYFEPSAKENELRFKAAHNLKKLDSEDLNKTLVQQKQYNGTKATHQGDVHDLDIQCVLEEHFEELKKQSPQKNSTPSNSASSTPSNTPKKAVLDLQIPVEATFSGNGKGIDSVADVLKHLCGFLGSEDLKSLKLANRSFLAVVRDLKKKGVIPGTLYEEPIENARICGTLFSSYKNITELNFSQFVDITNEQLEALISGFQNYDSITSLNFKGCELLESKALIEIIQKCPNLTNINLDFCEKIEDEVIKSLAKSCPALTHLSVHYCGKITDNAIIALSAGCSKLKHLTLSSCRRLTNRALNAIEGNCAQLEEIDLTWCNQIDTKAIIQLVQVLQPNFKKLILRDLPIEGDELKKWIDFK